MCFSISCAVQSQAIRTIEDLVSITFYEQTVVPLEFTFQVNSAALNSRLADPLSSSRNDFQGWNGNEFYDVYYSDSTGTFDTDGAFISITARFDRADKGGGLNIRGVGFNFSNGITILANDLASFFFAGNYIEGSETRAVNCDLNNWTTMGNTRGASERLRITLGLQDYIQKFSYEGCQGDGFSIDFNNNTYDESNPQGMELLRGENGSCDTLVEIDLNFTTTVTVEEIYQGCLGDGYFIRINDNTYNESLPRGREFLTSNTGGCDTMININLFFEPAPNQNINYTGCTGDAFSVMVNGNRYDENNPKGVEVIPNSLGNCDSTITVDLVFNEQVSLVENYSGCQGDGYSVTFNGTIYNESNRTGMVVLPSQQTCDTLVVIALDFKDCSQAQTSCEIYIPNAFSPNNDGVNDFFQIFSGQDCLIERFTIQVFNRWGTMVYTSIDPSFNWDGRVGGRPLEDDLLIWKISYQLSGSNTVVSNSGSILLMN